MIYQLILQYRSILIAFLVVFWVFHTLNTLAIIKYQYLTLDGLVKAFFEIMLPMVVIFCLLAIT